MVEPSGSAMPARGLVSTWTSKRMARIYVEPPGQSASDRPQIRS